MNENMTMTDSADLVWDENVLQSEGLKTWQKLAQERKNG